MANKLLKVDELRKMGILVFPKRAKQLSFTFNFRKNHAMIIKLAQKVKTFLKINLKTL